MKSLMTLSVIMFGQHAALGQEQTARPSFEVASVKVLTEPPAAVGGRRSTGMAPAIIGDLRQINFSGVKLYGVLCRAYGVRPNQIVGPDWLNSEWYSINAKVRDDAPRGQIPEMLQNLLAERFKVKVHWETKEFQGHALVVGKNEPKLTKSALPNDDASEPYVFYADQRPLHVEANDHGRLCCESDHFDG